MITLLIAIILIVFVSKNANRMEEVLIIVGITVGIILATCSILVPMAGFTEPVVETIELMPLRLGEEEDKEYYIRAEGSYYYYAYDNSAKYGLSGGAYEEKSVIKSSEVKIYESEDCTTPILKVIKRKSKISLYSFAGMWSSTEYIFYIPLDTQKADK